MADSNIIKIYLQTTGSNSGTWGTITNENLEKVEETLKGFIAVRFVLKPIFSACAIDSSVVPV